MIKAIILKIYFLAPSFFHALRFFTPAYYRGLLSARAYARYHVKAKAAYASAGHRPEPRVTSVKQIGADIVYPSSDNALFSLPDGYLDCVDRVGSSVAKQFELASNCFFFPRAKPVPQGARTQDIQEIKNGDVITIQMKDYSTVDGLEELCSMILRQLEKYVYCSYVIADKIYIYRSLISRQTEQISWLWHYDNHPDEISKVMVYLTDVDEQSGPFEYLVSQADNKPLRLPAIPNLTRPFIETRILPARLNGYLNHGYKTRKLIGPKGTTVLFSENIVHRANIAKTAHRDVVVIQVRPVTFAPERYINPRWSGSFHHIDVNHDPYLMQPMSKPNMASG